MTDRAQRARELQALVNELAVPILEATREHEVLEHAIEAAEAAAAAGWERVQQKAAIWGKVRDELSDLVGEGNYTQPEWTNGW